MACVAANVRAAVLRAVIADEFGCARLTFVPGLVEDR